MWQLFDYTSASDARMEEMGKLIIRSKMIYNWPKIKQYKAKMFTFLFKFDEWKTG